MEFKSQDIFSLSDKGKKEYGHIFCEGVVPVKYKYIADFSFREVLERRVDEDRMRLAPEILEKISKRQSCLYCRLGEDDRGTENRVG